MFLVVRRSAWRPGRGGCKGNQLVPLRFRGLRFVGGGRGRRATRICCSQSSATFPLTSARRTRRRCWLEVCMGAGKGGRSGGRKGTFQSRAAARGNRPVNELRCRKCSCRERHCSCRLPTLLCVRERSRAFSSGEGWEAVAGGR